MERLDNEHAFSLVSWNSFVCFCKYVEKGINLKGKDFRDLAAAPCTVGNTEERDGEVVLFRRLLLLTMFFVFLRLDWKRMMCQHIRNLQQIPLI